MRQTHDSPLSKVSSIFLALVFFMKLDRLAAGPSHRDDPVARVKLDAAFLGLARRTR